MSRRNPRALLLTVTASVALSLVGAPAFASSLPLKRGTTVITEMASANMAGTAPTLFGQDAFTRTVAGGWGTAGTGGQWTLSGATGYGVSNGAGRATVAPGKTFRAALTGASTLDADTTADFVVSNLATTQYLTVENRKQTSGWGAYRAVARVEPSGAIILSIRRVASTGAETVLSSGVVAPKATAGSVVHVTLASKGTAAVDLQARAWVGSSTVPSWQLTTTDSSDARVATAGSVAFSHHLAGGATASTNVILDNVTAKVIPAAAPAPAPTTVPTTPAPAPTTAPTTPAPTATAAPTTPAPTATTAPTTPTPTATTAPTAAPTVVPTTLPSTPATVPATVPANEPVKPGPNVKRDASNTGVPAGTQLKTYTGPMGITTPGTVLDGYRIDGNLWISAPNVTIRNSIITNGASKQVQGAITVTPAGKGFLLEDSEIAVTTPYVTLDGIKGAGFTLRRVNIHGGVDNVKVYGNDVLIEDSYLHETDWFDVDPDQNNGPTHNDVIQVLGGKNVVIRNNTMIQQKTHNASLQVTQDFAALTEFTFANNYVEGGTCSANFNHKKLTELRDFDFSNNVFGRDTKYRNCAYLTTSKVVAGSDIETNKYTDGTPIWQKYMSGT